MLSFFKNKFSKFLIVGFIAFIIDYVLLYLLTEFIGVYYMISSGISFIISLIFNYYCSIKFIFNSKNSNKTNEFIVFVFLSLIGLMINQLLIFIGVEKLHFNYMIIKLFVTMIVMIYNFTTRIIIIEQVCLFDKLKDNKIFHLICWSIQSFFVVIPFSLKLDITHCNSNGLICFGEKIYNSFKISGVEFLIIFILAFFFLKKNNINIKEKKYHNWIIPILSIFFSCSMVIGYSFYHTNSWNILFSSSIQLFKTILVIIGYYTFFLKIIGLFFQKLVTIKNNIVIKTNSCKYYFFLVWIIFFGCWLIYLVINYPGIVAPDLKDQILQFFNVETWSVNSIVLKSSNMFINGHHSVLHTLLVGTMIKIGGFLGSQNFGYFMYILLQYLSVTAIFAYVITFMKKINIPRVIRRVVFIILLIVGYFPYSAITGVKDVFFSSLILLYVTLLFKLYYTKFSYIKNKFNCFKLIIILLLILLSRNNGLITIICSYPLLFFLTNKQNYKKIFIIILIPITIFSIIKNVIYPYYNITPGSIREMLSVPFQQTARLIKDKEEVIELNDKLIIDKILIYETIANRYNPTLSDPVKNKFNKYATKEDITKYLKVWVKYLFKEPTTYIEATINNTYGYFYPNRINRFGYVESKDFILDEVAIIQNRLFVEERNIFSQVHTFLRRVPVIGLLYSNGTYVWLLLIFIGYYIYCKQYKYILFVSPLIANLLVTLLGPNNDNFRYTLPLIFSFPILITIFYYSLIKHKI